MNKIISSILIAALVATPLSATDYRYEDRNESDDTVKVVAAILGGVALGVLISRDKDDKEDCSQYKRKYRKKYCYRDDSGRYVKSRSPRSERSRDCYSYNYRDYNGTWKTRTVCD